MRVSCKAMNERRRKQTRDGTKGLIRLPTVVVVARSLVAAAVSQVRQAANLLTYSISMRSLASIKYVRHYHSNAYHYE